MCNVCVCNSALSRLRIWCGNPGLGTGSYGCQKEGSWGTEPLQAPVTKVGCGDLATCESLESGWTLYMFQSLAPREMGTSARGSPCVWLLSGLPSSFSPTARRRARPDRTIKLLTVCL